MRSITQISTLSVFLGIAFPLACAQAAFTPGDCLYITAASGVGPGIQPSVLLIKFNPISLTPLVTGNAITGDGAYDSFRQSAIVIRVPGVGRIISSIDSAGTMSNISYTGNQDATLVAPTGDGRIYIQRVGKWTYIDSVGATHDLLGVSGPNVFVPAHSYRRAFYDKTTNSIFAGDSLAGNGLIAKIPLSADGQRIASLPTEISLSTPGLSFATVVGISPGPNGKLFIKLDDNGGGLATRMLLLDPATLAQSNYAQSNYFGVGGEISGCYAPTINAALVVDTLVDQLRIFTSGATGEGTIVAGTSAISSAGGSGENATMFPIVASTAVCVGDLNKDGQVDDADFTLFVVAYNILDCTDPTMAAGCPADFNHDGLVDDADFTLFVVAYNNLICP